MNTIYTNQYRVQRYVGANRWSLFWNKAADALLCAASTVGVVAALFFLLTL